MFFLAIVTFYILGDILAHAYTFSRTFAWILVGLACLELWGTYDKQAN